MAQAYVCDAVRTPVGKLNGSLSNARIALSAVEELHRTGGRHALVFMCIGVGQGLAVLLKRV